MGCSVTSDFEYLRRMVCAGHGRAITLGKLRGHAPGSAPDGRRVLSNRLRGRASRWRRPTARTVVRRNARPDSRSDSRSPAPDVRRSSSTLYSSAPPRTLLASPQALPAPVPGPAAVRGQGVAVDEGALLGVGEKRDGLCNVLWSGEAAHRGAALYVLVGVAVTGLVLDVHLGPGIQKHPS